MPTKTQNTHFSERLYYLDSIFSNGNRIINLYDATGRKYKSIVYTIPATAVTTSYKLEHEAFGMDSMEYRITEYNDNEIIYDNNQSNNSSKDTDNNNKSG